MKLRALFASRHGDLGNLLAFRVALQTKVASYRSEHMTSRSPLLNAHGSSRFTCNCAGHRTST